MIINCFYEEEEQYPDIVYIPGEKWNIDSIQRDFFIWVFDEKKSNAKFVDIGGINGCSYNTDNFVYWLNEYLLTGMSEKACIVSKNARKWNICDKKLFF